MTDRTCYLYRHFAADGSLLYVGISAAPGKRTSDHARHSGWFEETCRINVERFDSREAALSAEAAAIKAESPRWNVIHNARSVPAAPELARQSLTRQVAFRPLYTLKTAAEELGLSPQTLASAVAGGRLSSVTVETARGARVMVSGWALIDWIESMEASDD